MRALESRAGPCPVRSPALRPRLLMALFPFFKLNERSSVACPARRAARAQEAHESQFGLLGQRRFAPFFWTQFLGAINDNVFKFAFTSLVTFQAARFSGVDPKTAAFLITAVFILPFLLFSATAGQLADKYDKARLMRLVKSFEIVVMPVAGAGFCDA